MQLYKLHSHLIRSHLHLIMSHNFSLSFNVGPNHFSFAFNSVSKNSCLQFHVFMIAGRYNKDPSELALEEFIEKKKRKEEAEASRITNMLIKGGLMGKYHRWVENLTKKELQEITEDRSIEKGEVTQQGDKKLKMHYAKKVVISEK